MKNRIVTEKCKTLRALARQTLKNTWQEAIVFSFICQILLTLPSIIYDALPSGFDSSGTIITIIDVYSFLVNAPISFAMASYFIHIFRQQEIGIKEALGSGFKYFSKALGLFVRIYIRVMLWSLLFLVPGIIAALNSSQAFLIMADNPSKSTSQCLVESKFIMQGNKKKYIALILSFAGWYLLSLVPAFICTTFISGDPLTTSLNYVAMGEYNAAIAAASYSSPIISLLELLIIVPLTYLNTAQVAFFDILVGKLVIHNVDEIKFEAEHTAPDTDAFEGVYEKKDAEKPSEAEPKSESEDVPAEDTTNVSEEAAAEKSEAENEEPAATEENTESNDEIH